MNVIVKGMEMPKDCADCPLDWRECEYLRGRDKFFFVKRPDDCPLVEIPTPCERLININTITAIYFSDADGKHCVCGERLDDLEIEADTIIEVEGET